MAASPGEHVQVDRLPPGTVVQHVTGGRCTLKHRKADESGWWNTDKSGFSDEALQEGLQDGTWRIVEPVEQGEVPEIVYASGQSTADALRNLADQFDTNEDLVLIGLWNIEPPENEYGATHLQVVVTHLAAASSGGSGTEDDG